MNNIFELWRKRSAIMEGIGNYIFKKEHVEAVAEQRMVICNSCPKLDTKGEHCAVKGTQPCCASCGCSLAYKTRSLSSDCPEGKWNAVLTEEEENLLNQKLEE
jgi:hypothetical protein